MAFGELDRDHEGQLLLESGTRNAAVYKLSDATRQAEFSSSRPNLELGRNASIQWSWPIHLKNSAYSYYDSSRF